MTDFTPEQIEAIEAAVRMEHNTTAAAGNPLSLMCSVDLADCIMAELQNKPTFRKGEVFAVPYKTDQWDYFKYSGQDNPDARHLTLSEMPQAVEDLRNAAHEILTLLFNGEITRELSNALAAFDAQVKP